MKPFVLALLTLPLCLTTTASRADTPPPPVPARPAPVLVGAGAEALANAERAFARLSVERGPVAAWAAFFAPDAVQLPADQEAIRGREAILAWLKTGGLDTPGIVLDWWPLHAEVATGGDLGYTFGEWEVRRQDAVPDAQPLVRGKFTSVWKKQADGTWKVILDTGNEYPVPKTQG